MKYYAHFGHKDFILCLLSAALLVLSFPNFNLWLFAWFGFVPAFFALNNKSAKEAFLLFFITGVIFWAGIIYWLVHVTVAGTIVLILYLALYFIPASGRNSRLIALITPTVTVGFVPFI